VAQEFRGSIRQVSDQDVKVRHAISQLLVIIVLGFFCELLKLADNGAKFLVLSWFSVNWNFAP